MVLFDDKKYVGHWSAACSGNGAVNYGSVPTAASGTDRSKTHECEKS